MNVIKYVEVDIEEFDDDEIIAHANKLQNAKRIKYEYLEDVVKRLANDAYIAQAEGNHANYEYACKELVSEVMGRIL